jgi:hypothetical protein
MPWTLCSRTAETSTGVFVEFLVLKEKKRETENLERSASQKEKGVGFPAPFCSQA